MKSIRQWKIDNGIVAEDFEKGPFSRYMGSTRVEVNPELERELKPKIKNIMDMQEFRSLPKNELLDKVKVVISQIVAEMGGSKVNARTLAKNIDSESPSGIEVSRFARMMGSNEMSVDQHLRRELRPKIERIMDMEEFKSMTKDDLEKELIAVASKVIAEISSRSFGVDSLDNKLNDPSTDDQVAKESKIVPSFLNWVEQNDQPAPDSQQGKPGAVSEPQHKSGEDNMDLKSAVEKKMMELAMELEQDGKGSRQDVLAAMKAVIDGAAKESENNAPKQEPPPGGDRQPAEGQPPQGGPTAGGPAPLGDQPPPQM